MRSSKITVYTQVYNTEKYLRQCLDSVVNQTYPIHQYIIVDNGCTDGCSKIINEYAEKFDFIEVIKHEENKRRFWHRLIAEKATGDYVMILDSDDRLELNCIEYAVSKANDGNYDIVAVSSRFCDENWKEIGFKKVENDISMEKEDFHSCYPFYYKIFRTVWGKLYKSEVCKKSIADFDKCNLLYGSDTFFAFSALRNSNKVLVLSDVLHNYTIHKKSVSHQYDSKQSDSDIILFNEAIDFLSQYGEISSENLRFVYGVYAYAIYDTIKNLVGSKLSAKEKLGEYLNIFNRKETIILLSLKTKDFENVKYELFKMLLSFVTELNSDFDKVLQLMERFSPDCSVVIDEETIKLFARNDEMMLRLFRNDRDMLADYILTLIEKNDPLTRVYDFVLMLKKLAPENSLVSNIADIKFIRLYSAVYAELWNKQNIEALEKMTEILFSGKELNCAEDFLNLYVTLAALENHVEAFLFGNIQKAYLFLDENRKDEARQIVNDLVEMGAGESEDVIELQKLL